MRKIFENETIKKILIRLEEWMINYLEYEDEDLEDEIAYNKSDIENCMNIMNNFLEKIEIIKNKENALSLVEETIKKLNKLNEKCEYELIETEQREDICEIIILATNLKWLNPESEDLTEEFRDF